MTTQPVVLKSTATPHVTTVNNLPLKIVLWLPSVLTFIYFGIGMLTLKIRYDIPIDEFAYVLIFIMGYVIFMDVSQYIRRKYWGLTKCKDL